MSMNERPKVTYHYRGLIEVGSMVNGYRWVEAYSANGENGGPLYPWMTTRECQRDAAARGCQAVFQREG
jgi:hypothetical protein